MEKLQPYLEKMKILEVLKYYFVLSFFMRFYSRSCSDSCSSAINHKNEQNEKALKH